jgi:type II secretory pathway predicted ATPase ExeA
MVGIREASFTWSIDNEGTLTPSKRKFMLKIEHELVFAQNKINLIVGPTGSGKTSLLMALLGPFLHFLLRRPRRDL